MHTKLITAIIPAIIIMTFFLPTGFSAAETASIELIITGKKDTEPIMNRDVLVYLKKYIKSKHTREAYGDVYQNNPMHATESYKFYLDPDTGIRNRKCVFGKSDFNHLVIRSLTNKSLPLIKVHFKELREVRISVDQPSDDLTVRLLRDTAEAAIINLMQEANPRFKLPAGTGWKPLFQNDPSVFDHHGAKFTLKDGLLHLDPHGSYALGIDMPKGKTWEIEFEMQSGKVNVPKIYARGVQHDGTISNVVVLWADDGDLAIVARKDGERIDLGKYSENRDTRIPGSGWQKFSIISCPNYLIGKINGKVFYEGPIPKGLPDQFGFQAQGYKGDVWLEVRNARWREIDPPAAAEGASLEAEKF